MKAKYIKDLDNQEVQSFIKSELYEIMNQNWATTSTFINYNSEYFGSNYVDYSFVIFESDIFYIGIYSYSNNQTISFFGQPVTIFNLKINSKKLIFALSAFYQKLHEIKTTKKLSSLYFYSHPYVLSEFINNQISLNFELEAFIDLNQTEDLIRMNIRKSYKSLINWGFTNLEIVTMDHSNPNKKTFDTFKNFHLHVAQKQTRSNLSWDLQFEAILNNDAFLVLGYFNDKLVSGAYIIHGSKTTYYGVAVNSRELMAQNLPIGHAVLFRSIIEAKHKGLKSFMLGTIEENSDEKVNDIIKYKKGFTNTIQSKLKHVIQL